VLKNLLRFGFFLFFLVLAVSTGWAKGACTVHLKVSGVEGKLRQNVLSLLEIKKEKDKGGLTPGRVRLLFKRGYSEIKRSLMPFGYFNPRIRGNLKKGPKRCNFIISYDIDKGPLTKISHVEVRVTGPGESDLIPFAGKRFFKTGEVFRQKRYERFKKNLISRAQALGYLDAFYKRHEVIVDSKTNSARIVLHLFTGKRYHFGHLIFKKAVLSPVFLRRFADFKYGEAFDASRLGRLETRLLDSDYFKDVQIDYSKEKASGENIIPVTVTCPMKRPNVFRLGLGYVSGVGARVSLEWQRRYLGKMGHHLRSRFQISPDETLISGEYIVPLKRPYSDYLSLKPFIEHYDTSSRNGWKYNVALLYSTALENGWRRNAGINFGYEDYTTGGDTSSSKELRPFVSWNKSVADNILYANRGYSIRFGLSGELGGFFAEKTYLSSLLRAKFIRRFARDYRIVTRLDAGAIATSRVDKIPSSARFYAGGQGSIRGFSLEELGPKNPKTGDVIGGRYLAVGSIELERHIYRLLSGAIFVDIGNSFDPDYSNKVEIGPGFGLRLKTVLGPVRLDFGFGVSRPSVPFKFYLSVGPDF